MNLVLVRYGLCVWSRFGGSVWVPLWEGAGVLMVSGLCWIYVGIGCCLWWWCALCWCCGGFVMAGSGCVWCCVHIGVDVVLVLWWFGFGYVVSVWFLVVCLCWVVVCVALVVC